MTKLTFVLLLFSYFLFLPQSFAGNTSDTPNYGKNNSRIKDQILVDINGDNILDKIQLVVEPKQAPSFVDLWVDLGNTNSNYYRVKGVAETGFTHKGTKVSVTVSHPIMMYSEDKKSIQITQSKRTEFLRGYFSRRIRTSIKLVNDQLVISEYVNSTGRQDENGSTVGKQCIWYAETGSGSYRVNGKSIGSFEQPAFPKFDLSDVGNLAMMLDEEIEQSLCSTMNDI